MVSSGAAILKKSTVLPSGSSNELINSIKKRVTRELVFAVSGQIGSGNSLTTKKLEKYLLAYGYTVHHIKLTDLAEKVKVPEMPFTPINRQAASESQRVESLQNHCDNIRLHYGCAALAQLAVLNISNIRLEKLGSVGKKEDLKFAYIIDSLKHPDEVRLLRQAYRTSFVLIGIETPQELRKARLTSKKGFSENDFTKLSMRDKDDDEKVHGQKVSLTVELSDIFLRNDCDTESLLENKIERFTKLIVGTEVVTPTIHESSMYAAYSNAARSGCLSRQVGAVIISKTGEVIATGTNDVPAFGGGQYTCELEHDERCYNKGGECYNDSEKKQLYKEIYASLLSEALVDPANEKSVLRVLKNSRIKGLIEFSRAVHAEMDAIISLARRPGASPVDGALYSTTYPCHSCARHIVAAGIKTVFYIEPYAKSLATKLHLDSISNYERDTSKVRFLPYEGVAPQRYLTLFQAIGRKKKENEGGKGDLETPLPKLFLNLDDFYDIELKIIKNAEDIGLVNSGAARVS